MTTLAALLFLSCAGCGEELGRDPSVTTRVAGTVRIGPKPITGGWVEFSPFDGAVGPLRSAPIGPDGSYAIDGVAVGTNAVAIIGAPLPESYRWRFNSLASPIRLEIRRGDPARVDVDLMQEYLRWQARLVRTDRE